MKTLLLLLLFQITASITSANAIADSKELFFLEKDGESSNIIYRAKCFAYDDKGFCDIKAIQLNTEKASRACSINTYDLITIKEATYRSNTWEVSSSDGLCGYENKYIINDTEMVQIKSSPKKKKSNLCEVFAPKTYRMNRVDDPASLPVGKCSKLTVSFP